MSSIKYLPNYTVEDYNRWEGDWELIDGIPYSMSPSPVSKHQQLGASLLVQIIANLKAQKEKCGNCKVFYELDWVLGNNTVVRPDIAITCEELVDFMSMPPELIIEILSPSTALKDRHVKFDIYRTQGVKYYIIIDPNTKMRQVYLLTGGDYLQQAETSSFIIHGNCKVELNLDEALAELED